MKRPMCACDIRWASCCRDGNENHGVERVREDVECYSDGDPVSIRSFQCQLRCGRLFSFQSFERLLARCLCEGPSE